MSEETAFDQMGDDLFNAIGIDAVFIPGVGDPISLKVHYDQTIDYHPDDYLGQYQGYQRTIEFVYADIGYMPKFGDAFEIDSTRYTVEKILTHENAGRFVKVIVN